MKEKSKTNVKFSGYGELNVTRERTLGVNWQINFDFSN